MLAGALSYLGAIATTRCTRDSAANLAHNTWIYLLPVRVIFSDVYILFFGGLKYKTPFFIGTPPPPPQKSCNRVFRNYTKLTMLADLAFLYFSFKFYSLYLS